MYIETETRGRVKVLWLNREGTNSLDRDFLSRITAQLETVESADDIGVVVIASRLPFGFSSGLDLKSLFVQGDARQTSANVYRAVKQVHQINKMITSSVKIYIAALSGPVIGSAASISLGCDLRIADDRMWFWLPDPQFGGLAADGGIELLREMLGVSRAKAMLITNRRMNAAELYDWGLLYRVVGPGQLYDSVMELADRLAGYSSLTLGTTKTLVNGNILGDFQESALSRVLDPEQVYERLRHYLEVHEKEKVL